MTSTGDVGLLVVVATTAEGTAIDDNPRGAGSYIRDAPQRSLSQFQKVVAPSNQI
jgi:hypothetical protein